MHGVSGDEVVEDGFEGFQLFRSGRGEEPDPQGQGVFAGHASPFAEGTGEEGQEAVAQLVVQGFLQFRGFLFQLESDVEAKEEVVFQGFPLHGCPDVGIVVLDDSCARRVGFCEHFSVLAALQHGSECPEGGGGGVGFHRFL